MEIRLLGTARLLVREVVRGDLVDVHRLLDDDLGPKGVPTLDERERGPTWTIRDYRQLALLHQPPYGGRAPEASGASCGWSSPAKPSWGSIGASYSPNRRAWRLVPKGALSAVNSADGAWRTAVGAVPPRKSTSTRPTVPCPNSR